MNFNLPIHLKGYWLIYLEPLAFLYALRIGLLSFASLNCMPLDYLYPLSTYLNENQPSTGIFRWLLSASAKEHLYMIYTYYTEPIRHICEWLFFRDNTSFTFVGI